MTLTFSNRIHFIYEVDNIPDHRSRRFGCCPCLLAVRILCMEVEKSRDRRCNVHHGRCKIHLLVSKLVLLLYHSMQP